MEYVPYLHISSKLEGLGRKDQYQLLLKTVEWKEFRDKIINRDNNKCTKCNKGNDQYPIVELRTSEWTRLCEEAVKNNIMEWYLDFSDIDNIQLRERQYVPPRYRVENLVVLEVHHRLYFYNNLPWQYAFCHLISLCQECHKQIHQTETIYTYFDEALTSKKPMVCCCKCSGTGHLPEYRHFMDGICFDCGGQGVLLQ